MGESLLPGDLLTASAPIETLRGVGPRRGEAWRSVGVCTVGQLLEHLPRRVLELPEVCGPSDAAREGAGARRTVVGKVLRVRVNGRARVRAIEVDLGDEGGVLTAVLFGPRFLARQFLVGDLRALAGSLETRGREPRLRVERVVELTSDGRVPALHLDYRLPSGVGPRSHRAVLLEALERCADHLRCRSPRSTRSTDEGSNFESVLRSLHFPDSISQYSKARRALAVDEAVQLQEALIRLRRRRSLRSQPWTDLEGALRAFERSLPFELTASQRSVLDEIAVDLASAHGMARLLSGDVGSGKTAVALAPLVVAALHGRQGVLLSPTEVLAQQHLRFLEGVCTRLGIAAPRSITGSTTRAELELARESALLVGTHRLQSDRLQLPRLACCVIDEQQKFGVRQRVRLWCKGQAPDLLLVSATPIPRTLAHAYLGHLDLSVLEARPDARRRVRSELLVGEDRRRVAAEVAKEVATGGQVFVVCPAVGESSSMLNRTPLPAAERVGEWFRSRRPEGEVEILHGRLNSELKKQRLERFARRETRVLVATVVIEVGIDVPDASLVVILGAERFGLSQLHQIRGRVGRRGQEARCLLVSRALKAGSRTRLEEFCRTDDGFRLAEADLEQRGPGELLGLAQHGVLRCRFPEILQDPVLLAEARSLALQYEQQHKSILDPALRRSGVARGQGI